MTIDEITAAVIAKIKERYILIEKGSDADGPEIRMHHLLAIIHICHVHFDIPKEELMKNMSRKKYRKDYSIPQFRFFIFLFARKYIPKMSLDAIGDPFGRTHCVVLHGISQMEGFISIEQKPYIDDYNSLDEKIRLYFAAIA